MKRFDRVSWSRWFLAIVAIMVGTTLSGCLKGDNQVYQVSAVRALNAVPGSVQLDMFLDQKKFNFDNVAWEDEAFAYADTLPYKNAWPNSRLVSIVDPEDYPNAEPIVQKTINFIPGKFYSVYVVGYDEMELLATEDDLSEPEAGKAKVRFIHLSPDAPALDIEIQAGTGDPMRVDDNAFKEHSDFIAIEGGVACTINFIDHGNQDVLHTFGFSPEAGMIYTVWAKGLLGNTADTALDFGHGVIIH